MSFYDISVFLYFNAVFTSGFRHGAISLAWFNKWCIGQDVEFDFVSYVTLISYCFPVR